MRDRFLIDSHCGERIYNGIRSLPIYDYHCHLPAKEIYEDRPCTDIGRLWLVGDHYKWRLMRAAGIDERLITGDAPWKDKFRAYAGACELAAGSPLYTWNKMELSLIFGIDDELTKESADGIYERANLYLSKNRISPRALIKKFNVEFIGTTDDIADSLEWHEKLAADKSFSCRVSPSFRCDRLLQIREEGYAGYIEKLGGSLGRSITDFEGLCKAVEEKLDLFVKAGCVFSDTGIPDFPSRIGEPAEADGAFKKALAGENVSDDEYNAFLGCMLVKLGRLYRSRNVIMQLHLGVRRNLNKELFKALGRDVGGDSIGSGVPVKDLERLFNAIGELPRVILYTLDPSVTEALVSFAGCFRGVYVGAAWWFNDHKSGIVRVLDAVASVGYLGSFNGMLTDSRSFLSYARHDYFRRILSSYLGALVESGEFPEKNAAALASKIACGNIRELIENAR